MVMVMLSISDGKNWGTERQHHLSGVTQAVWMQSPVLKYLSVSFHWRKTGFVLRHSSFAQMLEPKSLNGVKTALLPGQDHNYHGMTMREKQSIRICLLWLWMQWNHHFPLWYILLLFKNILFFRVSPKVAEGFLIHPVCGTRSYHFMTWRQSLSEQMSWSHTQ